MIGGNGGGNGADAAARQKLFKKRLKRCMSKPYNQRCADCDEKSPRWASIIKLESVPTATASGTTTGGAVTHTKMGAFICLECSGSHRRLGVHITFVRSITLDEWKEDEVLCMERGGNRRINALFENPPVSTRQKPNNTADGPTRETYIRKKYERRLFFQPEKLAEIQNNDRSDQEEEKEEQQQQAKQRLRNGNGRKLQQQQQTVKSATTTTISDVAQRRLAARQRNQQIAQPQNHASLSKQTQPQPAAPATNFFTQSQEIPEFANFADFDSGGFDNNTAALTTASNGEDTTNVFASAAEAAFPESAFPASTPALLSSSSFEESTMPVTKPKDKKKKKKKKESDNDGDDGKKKKKKKKKKKSSSSSKATPGYVSSDDDEFGEFQS